MAFLQRFSPRTIRITAASALALSFVGVAFLITSPSFWKSRQANAESTDDLLSAYASKDTDGDGLPDWEEALYGTDPNKAISNPYGIPDGEAAKEGKLTPNSLASQLPQDQTLTPDDLPGTLPAAGSLTEQFSHEFLQDFVESSDGQPMTDDQQQALVSKLFASYTQKAAQAINSPYTLVQVHTTNSSDVSAYAGQIESIISATIPDTSDNGDLLQLSSNVIEKNDTASATRLKVLAGDYSNAAKQMEALDVPTSMRESHLELVQAFDTVGRAASIVADYQSDPIGTMGALSVFVPARANILDAFGTIANAVLQGGEPAPGEPGYDLVTFVRNAQQPQ